MLANWYRDGGDKMGWHRDNEPELGRKPVILSVSLGATRDFQLRHMQTKSALIFPWSTAAYLVMKGDSQQLWEHQLPQRKRVQAGRINLLFERLPTTIKI